MIEIVKASPVETEGEQQLLPMPNLDGTWYENAALYFPRLLFSLQDSSILLQTVFLRFMVVEILEVLLFIRN